MKKTKLIFLVAVIIALVFIIEIFFLTILIPEKNAGGANSLSSSGITDNLASGNYASLTLTLVEVAKHNSLTDCWMIIEGKVYDVTSFAGSHPGGNNELVKGCGKDATSIFNTMDGKGKSHSSTANSLLSSFYLGDLNQEVSVSAIENKTAELKNSTIPNLDDDNDDDDDDEDDD
ncbi:cytochrome b5 domain-containing protein [Candidatus Pacearchaeota archaeon]|nr:cytochrome b5 domain-containing protein [Candidatus Pacearchaeota archaeon]